jgi:Outer membrane protein beta-barrel domain
MKKIITLATVVAAFSTSAFAQVSNFTGYSAGVNLDHTAVTSSLSDSTFEFDALGQHSVGLSLQGAYGVALSPTTVLGVGATYSLTEAKAGYLKETTGSVTFKAKNATSIYFEPGLLVNEKTLAYGKLSYETVKMTADGASGGDKNISGVGYGFGLRTMLDKAWSLQAEVKHVAYDSEKMDSATDFKTKATIGSIGVGYKF